ncbi:MAG: glycosyltransferase [Gemmatimonadaceae bacterium]|nr:glycosyltransferase [Gemmatimonadaceae bacterium]
MNDAILGAAAALPWVITPIVTAIRVRNSVSLDSEISTAPANTPRVSVIIPARNEARNIGKCLRSVLTTSYPDCEVIVIDDQSTDGTGEIARDLATTDPRLRVIANTPLPDGWFGKQWACATGAGAATGSILCFADADTTHSADLLTRSVNAILRRNADLFSVMGRQELGSFWERIVQPQIFGIMAVRFGGTETITKSPRATDKIANGQCLFVRREPYDALGGHALVKSHVADDLMMAQRFFAAGKHVVVEEGVDQLSTRMYTSFAELVHGWGKNVFAGGRDSVPLGRVGRFFYPLFLLLTPLWALIPVAALLVSLVIPVPAALITWAAIVTAVFFGWWLAVYRRIGESLLYAILFPLGAAVLFYIFLRAVLRGQKVEWKGREYVSG